MNMITTLETPLLFDNFQMGKFNIRLIWEVSLYIYILHLCMFVKKYIFTPIRTFICFWLWIIENVSTQNTFDLSNQQISRKKDDAGWERELRKCFNRLLKENKMRILFFLFLPFNSTCWNIKHWESFRCLIQVFTLL